MNSTPLYKIKSGYDITQKRLSPIGDFWQQVKHSKQNHYLFITERV